MTRMNLSFLRRRLIYNDYFSDNIEVDEETKREASANYDRGEKKKKNPENAKAIFSSNLE